MIPWQWIAPDWFYNQVQYEALKFNNRERKAIFKILSKMTTSEKLQGITTKYFMCINQGYYVIYLHNIKFIY